MYDEHVNAQSLKIKKIQITRMYQSDPLSCSAHLGMEEEKKRGKYGAYAKVFYTLPAPLFETQFPPCLAVVSAETQQEKVPNLSGNFPL